MYFNLKRPTDLKYSTLYLLKCLSYSVAGREPLKPTRIWQWMHTKESLATGFFGGRPGTKESLFSGDFLGGRPGLKESLLSGDFLGGRPGLLPTMFKSALFNGL